MLFPFQYDEKDLKDAGHDATETAGGTPVKEPLVCDRQTFLVH